MASAFLVEMNGGPATLGARCLDSGIRSCLLFLWLLRQDAKGADDPF